MYNHRNALLAIGNILILKLTLYVINLGVLLANHLLVFNKVIVIQGLH